MTQFWVSGRAALFLGERLDTNAIWLQFSFYNEFSGQIAYESWTLSFYNVVFTLLPPFVIGVFDQFVSARILDRYPQLYTLGQKNAFFTPRAFWMWIINALYHSVVCAYTYQTCTAQCSQISAALVRLLDNTLLGRPEVC